jgi:hypothetical protein
MDWFVATLEYVVVPVFVTLLILIVVHWCCCCWLQLEHLYCCCCVVVNLFPLTLQYVRSQLCHTCYFHTTTFVTCVVLLFWWCCWCVVVHSHCVPCCYLLLLLLLLIVVVHISRCCYIHTLLLLVILIVIWRCWRCCLQLNSLTLGRSLFVLLRLRYTRWLLHCCYRSHDNYYQLFCRFSLVVVAVVVRCGGVTVDCCWFGPCLRCRCLFCCICCCCYICFASYNCSICIVVHTFCFTLNFVVVVILSFCWPLFCYCCSRLTLLPDFVLLFKWHCFNLWCLIHHVAFPRYVDSVYVLGNCSLLIYCWYCCCQYSGCDEYYYVTPHCCCWYV